MLDDINPWSIIVIYAIAKADKCKALVIIDRTALTHKVHKFIHENDMVQLNKDPTDTYHKQIQIAIQNSEDLIDKNRCKYLLNIKPTAPKLNAYIKTHKENEPIRLVIDKTQAPAYKTANFVGKQIKTHKSPKYVRHDKLKGASTGTT